MMFRLSSRNSTPKATTSRPITTWPLALVPERVFSLSMAVSLLAEAALGDRAHGHADAADDDEKRPAVEPCQAEQALEHGEQPQADEDGPQAIDELARARIADGLVDAGHDQQQR